MAKLYEMTKRDVAWILGCNPGERDSWPSDEMLEGLIELRNREGEPTFFFEIRRLLKLDG